VDGDLLSHQAGVLPDAASVRRFITGGNATITLRNRESGERRTVKFTKPRDPRPGACPIFAKFMIGPDNEESFQYIGVVWDKAGSLVWVPKRNGGPAKIIEWLIGRLNAGDLGSKVEVWHEGRCGRCGRKLTVPESIASGFGPECINFI
jgi:hypothetical protein